MNIASVRFTWGASAPRFLSVILSKPTNALSS
jgi:hypothetical protein